MDANTSEMKQLKKDQDEFEKEHEKAFQEAIVSAEMLCGRVYRSGSVLMPLCYIVNPQETLESTTVKLSLIRLSLPIQLVTLTVVNASSASILRSYICRIHHETMLYRVQ